MFTNEKREGEIQPSTLEPWRQLLLDAADVMEKHGHCKYHLKNQQGQVCILGAMSVVDHDRKTFDEAKHRLLAHVGGLFISVWNNAPERTGPEVIAAMRACARQGI